MAERILMNEYRSLAKEKWVNIDLHNDDIFRWNVALVVVNPDSMYYGGYFKAAMTFPSNYPYSPPILTGTPAIAFRFLRPLFHPNIYEDGNLCISILHPPGDDEMSGELASERWSPAQRVESVLISILSLLDDAEPSSPANVDAGVILRKDPELFKAMVKEDVERSKKDIPEGYIMPTHESTTARPADPFDDDEDFWADSDEGSNMFGGSDSEGNMSFDDQDSGSDADE
ncbi:ubiquitin-conjugating enzyme [Aspergillus sclerotialis]|uniref:Ubiquitin-conjugating enzyme E2 2 n=1 Tax=Aspergillus sclerotialis TaxID=2070753 RepID=A0A3A2ZNS9_9EURO|nr:ubiquitin-conjugating enzyme [Aspergillus sclerotialis]